MKRIIVPALALALAAAAFLGGYGLGHDHGGFRAALEENKVAAACLRSKDASLPAELREYLKGRIYYNIASKYPNEAGYLLRRDWDFGPVDTKVLPRRIYVKDPHCDAESFAGATRDLSNAEQVAEPGTRSVSPPP
jgi:hypothetical protein